MTLTPRDRSKGGKARANKLSKKRRSEIASKGAKAMWAKLRAKLKATQ